MQTKNHMSAVVLTEEEKPGTRNISSPNIILMNCDDLGYGDLGCYGSDKNATPALDKMASGGVRFTDFYMNCPVCSASRASMLTGTYHKRINFPGVLFPGDKHGLHPDEKTIATLLKEKGYATSMVGKWHCGDQPGFLPTDHGFDHYFGIPYSNDMGIQANRGGKGWVPDWECPLPLLLNEQVIQEQPEQAGLTERYVERAVSFIRENKDKPFFLYFAHMHVHLPHYPPRRFLEQAQNGPYGAAVECIDWSVAVLMHELERLGLDENTLVVFTSDNGSRVQGEGGSNEPLRGTKGSTWDGGIRVPCIMRWKGVIPENTTCSALATSMDFLPTFATMTGAEVPTDRIIDGKDISDLMTEPTQAATPHKAFFYYRGGRLAAVRSGHWKLHVHRGGEDVLELYDLEADVGETTDLADQKPDVVATLQALIEQAREDMGDDATERTGKNCRPVGVVENPVTLTQTDENTPYMWAEYDLGDCG